MMTNEERRCNNIRALPPASEDREAAVQLGGSRGYSGSRRRFVMRGPWADGPGVVRVEQARMLGVWLGSVRA